MAHSGSKKCKPGLPPGYTDADIPGKKTTEYNSRPVPKEQYDMTHTLLEMPGGKPTKAKK